MSNSYLSSLFGLSGRTALCTGATRGIGQKLAVALAKAGADVVLVQRNTSNQETLELIKAEGRKAWIVVCDLADNKAVKGLVKQVTGTEEEGGMGITLDIVVNCMCGRVSSLEA
jgi:2-dehydro-3-deoxy-D-gluconate 5-dehydrogenase